MKRSRMLVEDYTVGWVCALPIELAAAAEMLDEEHSDLSQGDNDTNLYTLGRIGEHNVVIACLPAGQTGTNSAAAVAVQMKSKFVSIRFGLMVGIGGGVPGTGSELQLGDVVISQPHMQHGGVVQYDLGKTGADGCFIRTGSLNAPPKVLLNALSKLQSNHLRGKSSLSKYSSSICRRPNFSRESAGPDILFESTYHHVEGSTCDRCRRDRSVTRTAREVLIHYGTIASGNQVIKDGVTRDKLSSKLGGVLCFEMEAAGLMNSFPCLVIRGICDYADSHKNKKWQPYAAATAAACAKELLSVIPSAEVAETCIAQSSMGTTDGQIPASSSNVMCSGHDYQGQTISKSAKVYLGELPKLSAAMIEEQKKACLNSLSFQQIDSRLLNIKRAYDRTCNWLFEQPQYKTWLDRDLTYEHHGFMWIKGKPGAGKSTIMKHALLKTKKVSAGAITISFFFNARGSILEKSTLGMYRSLLFQLLIAIPPLQDAFFVIFLEKRKYGYVNEWNLEELQEFFITAVEGLQQYQLICFIDALDECEENEVREMVGFLERLGEIAMSSKTSLNICLSSRYYPHISIKKGIHLDIDKQVGHGKDIATYVQNKFKAPSSKQIDEIKAEILERASGVFLWVVLVVQVLNKAYDHGQIHAMRQRLNEIPDELDELFADILLRDAETRDESILCLQWLLFAQRPLKREELYFAVLAGTKPTALEGWDPIGVSNQTIDRFILSCSKGLAEVSKAKNHLVQFIHESVRDFFLLRDGLGKLQPGLVVNMVGHSEEQLKRCCYQYIVSDMLKKTINNTPPSANLQAAKDILETTSKTFPFLEYAVHNIFNHANAAQGCGISQGEFLRDFKSLNNSNMQTWINLNNILQRYEIRRYTLEAKLLYIFSEQNLSNLIWALLDGKADVDATGERYGSALQAASVNGHAEIVQLLIDASANVNVVGGEYGHSLAAAVVKNHETVVKLLLGGGATPNIKDERGRTPLQCAAEMGHDALFQLLLANPKVDPTVKDNNGRTLLCWAVRNKKEALVQLLLANPKVDPDSEDNEGKTPLHWAANSRHEVFVRLLLSNPKVNPDPKDNNGRTPLQCAAEIGHEAVVQLLLANPKVDPNSEDNNGWTPLCWAARNGRQAVVQLLLTNPKVDPDSKDNESTTPLWWAARNGHIAIIQLLLANSKVDPDSKDNDGKTPLCCAARNGKYNVVLLLIANPEVDPHSEDNNGWTPLRWATHNGEEAIVQLLQRAPRRILASD